MSPWAISPDGYSEHYIEALASSSSGQQIRRSLSNVDGGIHQPAVLTISADFTQTFEINSENWTPSCQAAPCVIHLLVLVSLFHDPGRGQSSGKGADWTEPGAGTPSGGEPEYKRHSFCFSRADRSRRRDMEIWATPIPCPSLLDLYLVASWKRSVVVQIQKRAQVK